MNQRFFICKHCGNIIAMVKDKGVGVICCGEKMQELIPGTVEAATEKHIPLYEVNGNKVIVKVGEVSHPMLEEHYIEWVFIETKLGNQMKALSPASSPETCFTLCENDELVAVYAYCNLHGLWKS